ncbi:MAG: hypothetical protein RLZZ312_276 [Bacteroidota bacterium]|jgi:outer membrane receptor protein involved in Fe transport
MKTIISAFCLLFTLFCNAQNRPDTKKVQISGRIIDKNNKKPLDYATITLSNVLKPSDINGGLTNEKGDFNFEISVGIYNIKIDYISYKPFEIKQKQITENTSLGDLLLEVDATQLSEVEIRVEKTAVDIKLDKKVYNVGKDLLVKGGTVSDVLDNIPSVQVDQDGAISLRGNDNVRILIDGKPTNAINVTEALRQIPADAIDKVEVVTNPSARYDSEGGGGLLNIILKKGKNQGLNGSFILSGGYPNAYGLVTAVNFKSTDFNLFSNIGYNYRDNPGNGLNDARFKNPDGTTRNFIVEQRTNVREREGLNLNFGMDYFFGKNTTWTNAISYRDNNGRNPETVIFNNFDTNNVFLRSNIRFNDQRNDEFNAEYTSNFLHKFKRDGHTFSIDASFSLNNEDDLTNITDLVNERTSSLQKQSRNIIQTDYVLPFNKDSQFEVGYKGEFTELTTDFGVGTINNNGGYVPNQNFTNNVQYLEKVNALYSQLGSKFNKLSVLFGLRWENSNIDVNLLTTNSFNKKRYNNFFPSLFFTYELPNQASVSASYSRRITRPRGRLLNPFSGYTSNINVFQGDPNLDPALTDAVDFGYLRKWTKLTLSTSLYTNRTTNVFQFARRESGLFANINGVQTPVLIIGPVNLATEFRTGFEFTLNYSPTKWWRLNSNFNFFKIQTRGDLTYINFNNQTITQNFDNDASAWFTRLTSKITLPYKIDWQTNFTYNAPQITPQGRVLGVYGLNLGFSKDVFKDKGTLALNVSDVFNSRKRMFTTELPRVDSYTEFQRAVRQFTASFTYRFNKKKTDREKPIRQDEDGGGMQG